MLFSPISIDSLQIKNRIVMAPMCMYAAEKDGKVKPFHIAHYSARALGGVGLITVEATGVLEEGKISDNCLGIYDDSHIDGLSQLVNNVKSNGSKISIQLAHAGRKSKASVRSTYSVTSEPYSDTYETPEAMGEQDITRVIKAFGEAAARAEQAGFDMVQIHAAHGYLLNGFLSAITNTRTDSYGGNDRAKILVQVVQAVKENFGGPVALRINGSDRAEGGLTPHETSTIIKLVKPHGVSMIDITSGGLVPLKNKVFIGNNISYGEIIKQETGLPTVSGGGLNSASHMQEILENNRADMVYIGRELLSNPFFPLQAAQRLNEPPDWPYTEKVMEGFGKG